jgi:hypothetical protein
MLPLRRQPRRRAASACIALAVVLGVTLAPRPGAADGALAVGLPSDVTAEGFAYGFAVNKASTEEASAQALRDCRTETPGIDKRAQALCAVEITFRNQCFAVAMDPQDATPGVGWAIGGDKDGAGRDALAKCVETAGDSRRDACRVTHTDCDGTAK